MNKKLVKIISIMLIVFLMVTFVNSISFATDGSKGKDLVNQFKGEDGVDSSQGEGLIKKILGSLVSVIRIVATGISLIMITFLGIKYMSAAPSEKANIKSHLITFTVGWIVVVGATYLLEIMNEFATNITTITTKT